MEHSLFLTNLLSILLAGVTVNVEIILHGSTEPESLS
jgi:hypothetical protein